MRILDRPSRLLTSLGRGIVGLCVLAFVACTGARDSGNPVILIPELDQNGNERFVMYKFITLPSPFKAEGEAARIFYDAQASNGVITSPVAEPQLTRSGNAFIPKDPASGTVLATYAFYEKMMLYERRVLLESLITWPRIVAVYLHVRDLPPGDEGNAVYSGKPIDITSILPLNDEGRVALSFNAGALGHEHLHAHFDAFVGSKLDFTQKATPEDARVASEDCVTNELNYRLKLIRGWNEGLADFYGAVTSQMPSFMLKSLVPTKVRIVNQMPATSGTPAQINNCQLIDPYYIGEQLSRALYAVAEADEFPWIGADAASLTKWERAARYVVHRLSQFKDGLPTQANWRGSKDVQYLDGVYPESALCFFLKDTTKSPVKTLALTNSRAIVSKAFSDPKGGLAKCDTQL